MESFRSNVGEERRGFAKEKTSSPEVYMESFLSSKLFVEGRHNDVMGLPDLRGYNEFIEELKARKVSATPDEIKRVFLGMNESKLLLLHFAKYELMFEYDEKAFCGDNKNALKDALDGLPDL